MKNLLLLILVLIFYTSINAQENYFLDNSTTISFFGGTSTGIFKTNYAYDENLRLISELTDNGEITYEYTGEYDNIKDYIILSTGIIANRTISSYDTEGFVIEELYKQYNYQTEELENSTLKLYQRDAEKRIINYHYYLFNQIGEQILLQEKHYEYNQLGITLENYTNYTLTGMASANANILYTYENDLLSKIETEIEYSNQINNSVKEFFYSQDQLISTEEVQYIDNVEGYSFIYEYEYTNEGFYIHQFTKYGIGSDFVKGTSEYKSIDETPYYVYDTIINFFQFDDQIFEEQSTTFSLYYTETADTAVVREVVNSAGFEGENFMQIKKDIYLRNGGPVNLAEAKVDVANIYPNPVAAENPIKFENIDKEISNYRILNHLGQTVMNDPIWNHESQIILAPSIVGNYIIQFYQEDKPIGKAYKIIVF